MPQIMGRIDKINIFRTRVFKPLENIRKLLYAYFFAAGIAGKLIILTEYAL